MRSAFSVITTLVLAAGVFAPTTTHADPERLVSEEPPEQPSQSPCHALCRTTRQLCRETCVLETVIGPHHRDDLALCATPCDLTAATCETLCL